MARIIREIIEVLEMHGDTYTGADSYAAAEEWDDYGFSYIRSGTLHIISILKVQRCKNRNIIVNWGFSNV